MMTRAMASGGARTGKSSRTLAAAAGVVALALLGVLLRGLFRPAATPVSAPPGGSPSTPTAAPSRGGAATGRPSLPSPPVAAGTSPAVAVDEGGRPLAGGRKDPDGPVTGPGAILILETADGRRVAVYPDAAGRFRRPVEVAEAGPLSLTAFLPGNPGSFLEGPRDVAPTEIGDGREFRFARAGSGALRVVCRDDVDRPLGAKVRIERGMADGDAATVATCVVDAATGEGWVRIEGPGAYRVVVLEVSNRAVNSLEGRREEVVIRAGSTTLLPLVFPSEAVITLRVVGPDGEPVAGALAGLRFRDAGVLRASSRSGRTDEEGRFRFAGLEPGPCVVLVTAAGREPAVEAVTVVRGEEREVILRSVPGGSAVSGRLLGLDAEHLRRLNVFAVLTGVAPELRHAVWTAELDRTTGAFRLTGLGRGRYELCVNAADARMALIVDATAPETDLGEVDLAPLLAEGTGIAALRVVSADPLARTATVRLHFTVLLRSEDWPAGLWWQRSAFLDRSEIRGLPPGRYRVVFGGGGNDPGRYDLSAEVAFAVPEGGGTVEVDLPAPLRN